MKVSPMPEKTWLETKKKRTGWYVLFILIVAVAGLAVFVRNNREMFFPKADSPKQEAVFSLSDTPKVAPKDLPKDEPASRPEKTQDKAGPDVKNKPAQVTGSVTPEALPDKSNAIYSVMLPDIRCALRDRQTLKVALSLELIMADGSFKREILLKRENLKVMVQKVISNKTLDELIVDSLRIETKKAMNKLLGKNSITDVEFRDFRIDKVK
jgi:flagellar basal body-associated protein FliL